MCFTCGSSRITGRPANRTEHHRSAPKDSKTTSRYGSKSSASSGWPIRLGQEAGEFCQYTFFGLQRVAHLCGPGGNISFLISRLGKMIEPTKPLAQGNFATRSMASRQLLRVNEDVVGKVKFLQTTRFPALKLRAHQENGRRLRLGNVTKPRNFWNCEKNCRRFSICGEARSIQPTTAACAEYLSEFQRTTFPSSD